MDLIEEADNKLACGIIAPIFWKDHSDLVAKAIDQAYKNAKESPVANLWMTNYATGMKVGPDQVHLIARAGRKYVALINDVFKQIDQQRGFGLVEFINPEASVDPGVPDDEPGFDLAPPSSTSLTDQSSPARTLSMASISMLPSVSNPSIGSRLMAMANPTTGSNALQMGSGVPENSEFRPYTGPFRIPPPPVPVLTQPSNSQSSHPPTTWPTMLSPELSASLTRIEQRLGVIETKALFDNLMMASLQEENDTEANRAMLNRVTIVGLSIPNLRRMTPNEKVAVIRQKVQGLFEDLQDEGQKFDIAFVRHLNRQLGPSSGSVIEVKLSTEKQAVELRANYVKKKKDSDQYDSINITPVVRLATRVRIEILQAVAKALMNKDPTINRAFCVQFVPKPIIKIVRKDSAGNELTKVMSFLEAVSWVKENNMERPIDFGKALKRAGSAFRGVLQQTFVVL
jgi:hypothetical protein